MNSGKPWNMKSASEEELVAKARSGDREAFGALVEEYSGLVLNSLHYMVGGTRQEAEDLAQETFVKAYGAIRGFKGKASFRTWLYRIIRNVAASHFSYLGAEKRKGPALSLENCGPASEIRSNSSGPAELAMSHELREAIEAAIQGLPPGMRELVILRDIEHKSYEEVSEIVEQPLGTVKSRIHRGRLVLREKLKRYL